MDALKWQIAEQLPTLFPSPPVGNTEVSVTEDVDVCSASRTVKSAIACWIRRTFAANLRGLDVQGAESGDLSQDFANRITVAEFHAVREIFENLQELPVFVDILKALSTTRNRPLLTAIADTVNYHFNVFHALGAAKDLFNGLFEQKKLLPTQEGADPSFTHGLIDLANRLPHTGQDLRRLRKEEMSLDPKQTAAAPSPISDNMVEAVHSDNPTFTEEMDQILTNGTSIDQPTLARVFRTITDHFEKSWEEANAFPCRYPELLARLRAFDRKSFDILATKWLDALVLQKARPTLSKILVPMICHKVFTLDAILNRAMKFIQGRGPEGDPTVALEVLAMLSSVRIEHMPTVDYRSYRFRHQQQDIIHTHTESLILLIHSCIIASTALEGSLQSQARFLIDSGTVKSFVGMVLTLVSIKDKSTTQYDSALRSAMTDILYQEEQPELANRDTRQKISQLLDNVSNLNRPLSQFWLRKIQASALDAMEIDESASTVLADVLVEKLGHTLQPQVALWSHLLLNLPADSALSIRETAEQAILSGVDDGLAPVSSGCKSSMDDLLDIVGATAFSISDTATSPMLEQISERLSRLVSLPLLNNHSQGGKGELDQFAGKVGILLRLLTVHQSTMQHPEVSQAILSRIGLSLAHLYTHLPVSSYLTLATHIFDVLALVSDSLSEDTRSRCIHTLSDSNGIKDMRICFIFGDISTSSEGEWLQLVSESCINVRWEG